MKIPQNNLGKSTIISAVDEQLLFANQWHRQDINMGLCSDEGTLDCMQARDPLHADVTYRRVLCTAGSSEVSYRYYTHMNADNAANILYTGWIKSHCLVPWQVIYIVNTKIQDQTDNTYHMVEIGSSQDNIMPFMGIYICVCVRVYWPFVARYKMR